MSTSTNGGTTPIFVLYKVINSKTDSDDPCFNAFPLPGSGGGRPTLAMVKQNCAALYGMNHLGPEGYHWRVCVEDKSAPGEGGGTGTKSFSWWDVQDENATLPVKEAPQSILNKIFGLPKIDHSDVATKAAKGAFKTLGKAMSQAVGADAIDHHHGPLVKIVAFKLLDIVKMHDDFARIHHGTSRGGALPMTQQQLPTTAVPPPSQRRPAKQQQPSRAAAAAAAPRPPHRAQQQQQQHAPPPPRASAPPRSRQQPTTQPPVQEASLMDFDTGPATTSTGKVLHHSSSMPASVSNPPPPNETRAEKLKREYAQKAQTSNLVWDDVDKRYVEADKLSNKRHGAEPVAPAKKEVGISLDPANAVGKSAEVQNAINSRVNKMQEAQDKALQEVREREETKKREEAEEDAVRKRLDPKIKVWSEEHGKKKQLRALLASLHTILWPDAKWKQVTIGDLLDDRKVTLAFHKASRVVHPDKAHHLDAEKRFLAKRIFDALSQAKADFENGKN